MGSLVFVLCTLCVCSVLGSDTYKVAVADIAKTGVSNDKYEELIHQAAETNVDVLVLPSPKPLSSGDTLESCMNEFDKYDEIVRSVSKAAKKSQLYVVAHLYEKTRCQNKDELIRSNLVFDRDGGIISVYRKPLNTASHCNTTMSKMGQFTTDFGVTFGVLMEEDIILNNIKQFSGIKNFIISGSFVPKTKFLFATQFASSWAYANKVNLVSSNGIIGGNIASKKSSGKMIVAEIGKHVRNVASRSLTTISEPYSTGDMSQFTIKPLDVKASSQGYTENVCQGNFCCQFYVKTNVIDSKQDISYGLVAFDGIQELGLNNIGVQTCGIVACTPGLYKRSCFVGSENSSTNVKFEKIIINANFTEDNTAQFPTILTSTQKLFNKENFKFTNKNKQYTTELYNSEVLTFGIFSRIYSRDYETTEFIPQHENSLDFSDYISMENVQEFFDYLWIRLRVLLFIVSIYFLEMM